MKAIQRVAVDKGRQIVDLNNSSVTHKRCILTAFGFILGVDEKNNLIRPRVNFAQPNFIMRILHSLIVPSGILK